MFVPVLLNDDTPGSESLPLDPRLAKDLCDFVGPNADYYLRQWKPLLVGGRGNAGFNIAAWFFSLYWLGYRKMYRAMLILAGVLLGARVLEIVLFGCLSAVRKPPSGLGDPVGLTVIGALVGLTVSVVCGVCGNRWYLAHARRVIDSVAAKRRDEGALWVALARRGGTNRGAAKEFFLLFAVAYALVSLVVNTIVLAALL